jgi:hypothetical protein
MDESGPPITAEIEEEIAGAHHDISRNFAKEFERLPTPDFLAEHGFIDDVLPPKRPIRLCEILGRYATQLFIAEDWRYPAAPGITKWRDDLSKRVEGMVIRHALSVGSGLVLANQKTLKYHASEDAMHQCIRKALAAYVAANPKIEMLPLLLEAPKSPPDHINTRSPTDTPVPTEPTKQKAIGQQIDALRLKCDWTAEFLAEQVGLTPRSVYRHLSGEDIPSKLNLAKYERSFSEKLGIEVVIQRTSVKVSKRQKKS